MVLSLERWLGKVAVVTGANSGIGAAISQKLAEEGIVVVGLDKYIETIEKNSENLISSKGKLFAVKIDVTREDEIVNAFEWIKGNVGPVSILVNCAGIFRTSSMLEGKTEDWRTVLEINLLGLSTCTREAIKVMREHKIDGHIINISSLAAHEPSKVPNLNMYPSSKFAVKAVTDTIRLELEALNSKIKIGCISPGAVNTILAKSVRNIQHDTEGEKKYTYLSTEDISDAIVYILSTPPLVQIRDLIITKTPLVDDSSSLDQ